MKGLRIRKPLPPPKESVLTKVPRSVDEGVARLGAIYYISQ